MASNRPKSAKKSAPRKSVVGARQTKPPPDVLSSGAEFGLLSKRKIWITASAAAVIVVAVGFGFQLLNGGGPASKAPGASVATFVGSETCAGCHRAEASFDYHGVHSRFFRKDGKFLVETDGPDGKLGMFEVKYTFGLDPLQQYLVEFPDGRLQALSLAWDSRAKEAGGQRWFHLYPNDEIKHDDVLHWSKLNQNWNFMCAECHSTGVQKNYDAANDRFGTIWAEISVGCEACHGKGSRHIGWARDQQSWWPFGKSDDPAKGLAVFLNERNGVTWLPDPKTGNPQRGIAPAVLRREVETCGLCHARRSEFSEDWVPGQSLSDTHVVSTLARGLYHADGQMLDEVYNYGSFKQSKMFAVGVTCSDCHDPHAAKLRVSGDGVCLQCHASDKYEVVTHHRHKGVTPAVTCASCHMPVSTYMVIDKRHDHSLRIPRPDLSVKLGTPNACNACHTNKSAEWAASTIEQWHGTNRKGFQNYAEAFHASWTDRADAAALLAMVAANPDTPAIARASALTELHSRVSPATFVSPLLSDSSRGVRIRAAALLADVPAANQPAADRASFERAAAEFVAAQHLNADRPEARSTLGNFYTRRGLFPDAETEYKAGLRLSPKFAPAAINLADLYRQLGRDSEAENVLRTAIATSLQDAGLHHALGLALTRLKRPDEALSEFRVATELESDRLRYGYVYAVALHTAGRTDEAMKVLKESLARHPNDRDTLLALVTFNRDGGDIGAALNYAEQLTRLAPNDRELNGLVENLRARLKK